ncbi:MULTISPECIES: hypothetical protein [Protofrankia]|uniref:Uncharacterized protein n=1 Tax=Candidatus Protofrankia datiscae TaxID=2716812 RepID=F8B055_9ACTN|nr:MULTISPECIES: hypothetical protein [Protofrankia]AEH11756.1 hypothetical protein FsymDg_4508 [Candidatus Protofrankia datiscae]
MTAQVFAAVAALAEGDQTITLPSTNTLIMLGVVLSGIALVSGRLLVAAVLAVVTVGVAGLASIAATVSGPDDVTRSVTASVAMLAGLRLRRGTAALIPPGEKHRPGWRRFRRQRPDSVPAGQPAHPAEENSGRPRENSGHPEEEQQVVRKDA